MQSGALPRASPGPPVPRVGKGFCSVRPKAWALGLRTGFDFGEMPPPTEAEGRGKREDSRGGLCVIGAGALVEGALLEAGGNGGGIVF